MSHPSPTLEAICRRVAQRLLAYPWKMWFWGDSIGLEGLLDAADITGEREYFAFVHGLMKAWAARANQRGEWEYTAPGLALMRVHEQTGDPALLELARSHAAYLAGFRQSEGGLFIRYENAAFDRAPDIPGQPSQSGAAGRDGGPCAFVDTMHFDAPFFAALFRATREPGYARLAVDTLAAQIEVLFDRDAGLFHHFWIERTRRPNHVFWGRGNGWALLGIVRTLEALPESERNHPPLLSTLRRQAETLARLQDESGHWHTVLDQSSSYLETSIAAFVVDGFSTALRHGWIDASYQTTVQRALPALLRDVQPDGLLRGVSYETFPSTHSAHYCNLPRGAMVPWGQGPLLTAIRSHRQTSQQLANTL